MKFMGDSQQALWLWWLAASRAIVTWPNKQLSTLVTGIYGSLLLIHEVFARGHAKRLQVER